MPFGAFATFMFILGVLAYLNPNIGKSGGLLRTDITVDYIATYLVYLVTGLTLPVQDLSKAYHHWDTLLFTQCFAFIMFQGIMAVCTFVLQFYPVHPSLLEGFEILSTLPPSVSTATMLTKLVGGNTVTSSMNSVFGCLLGILLTPIFIALVNDSHDVDVPNTKVCLHLFLTAALPLLLGQFIQYKHRKIPYGSTVANFGQVQVLFAFYARACNALTKDHTFEEVDKFSLIITIVMLVILHITIALILLLSSYYVFHYSSKDAVAIMFVASRKSITLGLPIIVNIFEDCDEVGCLSLPLIVYSVTQILIGGLSVHLVKWWMKKHRRRR
ncbi:hypothetical protein BsWGS_17797 [Bradybaena similaris]